MMMVAEPESHTTDLGPRLAHRPGRKLMTVPIVLSPSRRKVGCRNSTPVQFELHTVNALLIEDR